MTAPDIDKYSGTAETIDAVSHVHSKGYGVTLANKVLHSRFVQRLHRRYPEELALLPQGLPNTAVLQKIFVTLCAQGHDIGASLRILRQLVLERLAVLDCDGGASMQDITRAMTCLAEFALEIACNEAFDQLDVRHGKPLKPDGSPANLWIIGMGKLGARELNVSSDIDLIYVYETDGDTAGPASISFREYFSRAVKRIYALIGETTEHGFVFRIDLALRPNGNSGPVVISLQGLSQYLKDHGREWERFAWLKSRVVAPHSAIANRSARQLRHEVLPFVFRRYLDYNVYEALRVLHDQIRAHAISRSAGHPERINDIKISRGGIREVEFTVQLLQVVRGGQYPELRVRSTVEALAQLAHAGLLRPETADALTQAYIFLRQVEHRIQYLDDQQTHVLPTDASDLLWLAQTLDYADTASFMQALEQHRELVAHEFDVLLSGNQGGANKRLQSIEKTSAQGPVIFDASMAQLIAEVPEQYDALLHRLLAWRNHARVLALKEERRQKLTRLMRRSLHWLLEGAEHANITETGVLRFMDWLETLLRRESYLSMLLERPLVHEHLLQLLGAARWPARYLTSNPGVIDELDNQAMFEGRFDAPTFINQLTQRLKALQSTAEDDEEALLNLLRRAKHAETLRTLVRDLDGRLTVEQVGDDLSALADAVLHLACHWCWQRLLPKVQGMGLTDAAQHRLEDHFAIVAYGKLGGLELGYGSDLDVVFVYEDSNERAGEMYTLLVRKLIMWLTSKTSEGDLYEIDTALRPNGNDGLLITSMDAFEQYQLQRGSNTAWLWEHQAMTRARCCFGSQHMRSRFDAMRSAVITAARDEQALRQEIVAMRQRVSSAHSVAAGQFNLKHSQGGMIDAEFITQYLVLLHSRKHPSMLENRGNITLLERADDLGILPAPLGHTAASAYRSLRYRQHRARLNEEGMQCEDSLVQEHAAAIAALWQQTLNS